MMTSSNGNISALLAICAGNSPGPSEFPTQRPVTGAMMFSLTSAWINGWVNNLEAGDLRRNRAHYDVTVMRMVECHLAILAKLITHIDGMGESTRSIPESLDNRIERQSHQSFRHWIMIWTVDHTIQWWNDKSATWNLTHMMMVWQASYIKFEVYGW